MSEESKPDWWPENPYPESVFPMKESEYPAIVPDGKTRTALSGMLARRTWRVCSEEIWGLTKDSLAQLDTVTAERDRLKANPRCPCGGVLEGVGVNVKTDEHVYDCQKCSAQLTVPQQALTPDKEPTNET